MDQIAKQTAVTLTFQKQPETFLTQVGTYLETMQKVYRTKLPGDELEIWAETLKDYSFQEFDKAMKHLVANPPKYELEDGTTQVWRGMPKLPDVIDVMLDLREKAVVEAHRREAEDRRREFAELEKRRAEHPEEFFSLADALREAQSKMPNVAMAPLKEWPQEPKGLDERQTDQRRQEMKRDFEDHMLRQQAEQIKAGK